MDQTLHQLLKESTRKRHEQAEAHPFQGALVQGRLPLASYASYMCQLAHLHEGYEAMLRKQQQAQPQLGSLMVDDYYQLPTLLKDLSALDKNLQSESAFSCVQTFLDRPLFSQAPLSLLGILYVLLGSRHGGKFIARKVKETYHLEQAGYLYFDPFGERFRELWTSFTGGLNALSIDETSRAKIVEGADETFETFVKIGDEIWRKDRLAQPATT